jgi:ATP-dependent DNA helicase Rep
MPARHIAAVTFTNKAAREMKERVLKLVAREDARGLIVSTFHNLGLRILKAEMAAVKLRSGFSILDQSDSRELMRELLHRGESERDAQAVEFFQSKISQWKNDLVTPEQALSTADSEELQRAAITYGEYNRMLRT